MPMYDFLYYICNNSMTSGSLWSYNRDEMNDNAANYRTDNSKTEIIESTPDDN